LAFLFQNSFLAPSLGYDVLPFLQRGQPTLVSLNVCISLYSSWNSGFVICLHYTLLIP
jgi:hypothetical protein